MTNEEIIKERYGIKEWVYTNEAIKNLTQNKLV